MRPRRKRVPLPDMKLPEMPPSLSHLYGNALSEGRRSEAEITAYFRDKTTCSDQEIEQFWLQHYAIHNSFAYDVLPPVQDDNTYPIDLLTPYLKAKVFSPQVRLGITNHLVAAYPPEVKRVMGESSRRININLFHGALALNRTIRDGDGKKLYHARCDILTDDVSTRDHAKMHALWQKATDFLKAQHQIAKAQGVELSVIVNCHQGISRGPSTVIALLLSAPELFGVNRPLMLQEAVEIVVDNERGCRRMGRECNFISCLESWATLFKPISQSPVSQSSFFAQRKEQMVMRHMAAPLQLR